jgi:hypothetical protein
MDKCGVRGPFATFDVAPFLRRTDLIMDQHADPLMGHHFFLDLEDVIAVAHRDPEARVFFRLVGCHHDMRHTFGLQLRNDAGHGLLAINRLAPGHGHGIIEKNFETNGLARGNRLADGQGLGMEIGAVADIYPGI